MGSLSFVGSQMISIKNNDPKIILKPGLTGLPQIKLNQSKISSSRYLENYYAMNYSIVFDIEILLKSIFKV